MRLEDHKTIMVGTSKAGSQDGKGHVVQEAADEDQNLVGNLVGVKSLGQPSLVRKVVVGEHEGTHSLNQALVLPDILNNSGPNLVHMDGRGVLVGTAVHHPFDEEVDDVCIVDVSRLERTKAACILWH